MTTEIENLLNSLRERFAEKDEVIDEQMAQIAELEDRVRMLEAEAEELKTVKAEYQRIKADLGHMLKD